MGDRKFKGKSLPTVIEEISQEISHITGKPLIEKVRLMLKTFPNRKEVVKEVVVHKGDKDLWEKVKHDFQARITVKRADRGYHGYLGP
jgi:hypothetical protein